MSQKSHSSRGRAKYPTKRYWFITWNNPPEDWKNALHSLGANWAIGQLEQGSEGTQHIQALLHFAERLNNSYWVGKKCWAKAIPSDDVKRTIQYVTKEDTRVDGPYTFGKVPNHAKSQGPPRGRSRDWDKALDLLKEGRIKEVEPAILIPHVGNCQKVCHLFKESTGTDAPRGIWIVGAPGTGKSYYARSTYSNAFIKAQNKWWDGYTGQGSVILDDLDKLGSCLGHYLKIWLDQYACDGEVKGGTTPLNYTHFVITSNYWPDDLWDDNLVVEAISRRCMFIYFHGIRQCSMGPDFGIRPTGAPKLHQEIARDLDIKLWDPFDL